MSPDQCQLRSVAEAGCCALSRCEDCGRFLLQVGPVSVRVPATVVRELHRCLGIALARNSAGMGSTDDDHEATVISMRARH